MEYKVISSIFLIALAVLLAGCIGGGTPQACDRVCDEPFVLNSTSCTCEYTSATTQTGDIQVDVQNDQGVPVSNSYLTVTDASGNQVFNSTIFESRIVEGLSISGNSYSVSITCPTGYSGSSSQTVNVNDTSTAQLTFICTGTPSEQLMNININVFDNLGGTYANGTATIYDNAGNAIQSQATGIIEFSGLSSLDAPYTLQIDCTPFKPYNSTQTIQFDSSGKIMNFRCYPPVFTGNITQFPADRMGLLTITVENTEVDTTGVNMSYKVDADFNGTEFSYINMTTDRTATLSFIPSDTTWPHTQYRISVFCSENHTPTILYKYLYDDQPPLTVNCSLKTVTLPIVLYNDSHGILTDGELRLFDYNTGAQVKTKTYHIYPPYLTVDNITVPMGSYIMKNIGHPDENTYLDCYSYPITVNSNTFYLGQINNVCRPALAYNLIAVANSTLYIPPMPLEGATIFMYEGNYSIGSFTTDAAGATSIYAQGGTFLKFNSSCKNKSSSQVYEGVPGWKGSLPYNTYYNNKRINDTLLMIDERAIVVTDAAYIDGISDTAILSVYDRGMNMIDTFSLTVGTPVTSPTSGITMSLNAVHVSPLSVDIGIDNAAAAAPYYGSPEPAFLSYSPGKPLLFQLAIGRCTA